VEINPQENTTRYTGIYRGLVINNNDELKAGRCQIQVFPMFATMDPLLLPWAVPAMPVFAGAGQGYGTLNVPEIDSYVFVFFENGDVYQPVYFAEAGTKTMGVPAEGATNYPYRRVSKSPSGITTIIDDIDIVAMIIHPTGTIIEILTDGQVNVISVKGINLSAQERVNIDSQNENVQISAGNNVVINTVKDTLVNAGQDVEVRAANDVFAEATRYVIMKGSEIYLNPAI
jgi:hypothetical protein